VHLRNAMAPMPVAPMILPAGSPISVPASVCRWHDGGDSGLCWNDFAWGQGSGLRRNSGESYQAGTGCNDDAHQRLLLGRAASRIAKSRRGAKPRSSASIAREDEHDREQRDDHREAPKGLHGSIATSREGLDQRHDSDRIVGLSRYHVHQRSLCQRTVDQSLE
jgi:hypothetical protein